MEGKQHGDVVSAIKAGGDETKLLVVDKETDEFFKKCKVTPSQEHLHGELGGQPSRGCWLRPTRSASWVVGGQLSASKLPPGPARGAQRCGFGGRGLESGENQGATVSS